MMKKLNHRKSDAAQPLQKGLSVHREKSHSP